MKPLISLIALLVSALLTVAPVLATDRAVPEPANAGRLATAVPPIGAGHAAVLALSLNGTSAEPTVLFGQAMRVRVAPASLTKLMTARVALQHGQLGQRLTVAPEDLVGQASMGLRVGETLTLEDLLYGLLLPSGNDAAMTIARALGAAQGGGSPRAAVERFVGWMNAEATALGLVDTHFVNPHGLDRPGHFSTAYDLARLSLAATQDARLTAIAGTASRRVPGHALAHGHQLVAAQQRGVIAGKTGLTRGCRFCLATVAERDGQRLAVVILRATRDGAYADTQQLLEWAASGDGPAPERPSPLAGLLLESPLAPPRGSGAWTVLSD